MYQPRLPRFEPSAITTLLGADFIRQLVDIAFAARKELSQMIAGGGDRFDNPVGELAVLESDGQLRGDVIPEAFRDFLIDAAVAEDHELTRLASDEKQHAVAQIGLGHAEALESFLGEHADVGTGAALHVDANLSR